LDGVVTPTHSEGLAAAKRVQQANADGHQADARDAITMMVYHLTLVLRMTPERERMAAALQLARQLIANTRESLG
jgi:hypothetical protein